MLHVDYLIIGQGVAGSCFAIKLLKEGRSFSIIDRPAGSASSVAVGIYNPVVLKRFSLIWNAERQLSLMHSYFSEFENLLGNKYIYELPTKRIIKDQNEIHAWGKKTAQKELSTFLEEKIHSFIHPDFDIPWGYGEVKNTGRIDLGSCLKDFRNHLVKNNLYHSEQIIYSELKTVGNEFHYKDISAKNLVFSEGFGITQNPFFSYLPVIGVKGEVLKIKTKNKIPKAIWKAHNFLMPLEGEICLTASTYDRDDLSPDPTQKGKEEMIRHLQSFYKGDFEILDHTAGIRPTIIDRRPVVGQHPAHQNMFVLNGMGTRGTLLAPAMSEELFDFIEKNLPVDPEADVARFTKKYFINV